MKRILFFSTAIFLTGFQLTAQPRFLTTAESSDFKSTSDYGEVMAFIDLMKKSSRLIRVETIAKSADGRDIPLMIIGNPLPESPEKLINDNRIVIYVQANIHAGEVEGKEASLMFVRDLLSEKKPELLKNVILLVCPNFNPDGNEQISPLNRTYQNGPINGVGVRYNGQYLDLNRDAMKAESPEVRGVITRVFNTWDPSVFMDCHTTDGSYHVEPVTFTWMVNPNGDTSLIHYMHKKMIPEISGTLLKKYRVENCYYGEFNDMMHPEKGWFYDVADPRYMTNYYGLRNRLAILNENYVYADYKSRVWGCYYLIKSLTDYASLHKAEIKEIIRMTDARTIQRGLNPAVTDSFAIENNVRPLAEPATIKTFEAEPAPDSNVWPPFRKTDRQVTVTVPYYIDFYPTRSVKFPYAYLVTVNDTEVIDLLKRQGISIEKLAVAGKINVEKFEISELAVTPRLNQGHYTNTVKGRFLKEAIEFPAGTLVIRTAQPLANLAAYLLEPQSNDGLLLWNYFDRYLVPQWGEGFYPYPVYKVISKTELDTKPVI